MAKHYKTKHFNNYNKKELTSKQKRHKKSNILLIILRLFFIITIIISTIYIINWGQDNKANAELNEHLSQYISVNYDDTQDVSIDFDRLKQENNYFFAWLIVNGTNINYPVVHYTDNDYYLTHSFDNSNNNAGCPFVDYKAKGDGTDKNLVIYAHNRRDRQYVLIIKKCYERKLVF